MDASTIQENPPSPEAPPHNAITPASPAGPASPASPAALPAHAAVWPQMPSFPAGWQSAADSVPQADSQADCPPLTATNLKAHDARGSRHSRRQQRRQEQREAREARHAAATPAALRERAIARLEPGPFRDAAAETIYGLEAALSVLVAEHARLEGASAALEATVGDLRTRNASLAQRASRERAGRVAAEAQAAAERQRTRAEVAYLRQALGALRGAAGGKDDRRSHRTIAPRTTGAAAGSDEGARAPPAPAPAAAPPWHPGNGDDGVDHGDIYADVLNAFVTHGTMPTAYWTAGA